jgi:hypothetical protein
MAEGALFDLCQSCVNGLEVFGEHVLAETSQVWAGPDRGWYEVPAGTVVEVLEGGMWRRV